MLSLARADALERRIEPCDLVALAQDVTRAAWPTARARQIDLGFEPLDVSQGEVWVMGHAALLKEALSNLLHNALHHTPLDAKVTVQAGIETWHGETTAIPHAVLRVIDNGLGMTAEELARAGERFFRGRAQANGSGLGLAIAKAIAQRHGGHLDLSVGVDDTTAPGLTVTLHWPTSVQGFPLTF